MRAHSAGDTAEREPWSFGPESEALNRKFIELRYKLLAYIYSVFWEHTKYGFPILRPVTMVEQHLDSNIQREEEFCFGDKLLVSPVLNPGQHRKKVYLPKGRSEEHTSELQSLMRISYAVFCLKKKKQISNNI